MTVQKLITYDVFDTNGKILDNEQKLKINITNESGNYLIHKDILRHQINQKQGTVSTKTRAEVRGGVKKELVVQELVQIVLHSGKEVVLFLVQNQIKKILR